MLKTKNLNSVCVYANSMKTIVIDDNAHQILLGWKKCDEVEGIENPTHSQAIRWARDRIKILDELSSTVDTKAKEQKKGKK